jgi:hypothetical protein
MLLLLLSAALQESVAGLLLLLRLLLQTHLLQPVVLLPAGLLQLRHVLLLARAWLRCMVHISRSNEGLQLGLTTRSPSLG